MFNPERSEFKDWEDDAKQGFEKGTDLTQNFDDLDVLASSVLEWAEQRQPYDSTYGQIAKGMLYKMFWKPPCK